MNYINHRLAELASPVWRELFLLIKSSLFYLLLVKVALFRPLPNNGLLQITGISIKETARCNNLISLKIQPEPLNRNYTIQRSKEVAITKTSIMYSSAFVYSNAHKIRFGLRPQRMLLFLLSIIAKQNK